MASNLELIETNVTVKADYHILLLLSLGHLAADLNQGALPVLLPRLFNEYELSYTLAGTIMLIFSFSSSIVQPLFGWLSDKGSTLWILPAGVLLGALGMSLLGYVSSFSMILLFAFISGIGVAAYHPEGSKVTHFASGPAKASAMSVFSLGGNLGFGLGAIVMAFFLAIGGAKGTIYLLIPGVLVAGLLWFYLPQLPTKPRVQNQEKKTADNIAEGQTMWTPLVFLIIIIILRSFVQSGLVTFIPLYIVNYLGMSEGYGSTLIAVLLLAGAFGTVVGGPLADRYGKTKLMAYSMGLMPPLILGFLYGPVWLSVIALALTGAVLISTFSSTVVLGQMFMPNFVGVASGLTLGFAVGTGGVGAVLLGKLADNFGLNITMLTIAFLPAVGLLLIFFFALVQKKYFGKVS